MTDQDIANALRTHLAGTPDAAPIVWENASGVYDSATATHVTPAPPFWVVSMVTTPPDRFGITAAHIARGRMVVSVMALTDDADGYTREAETQAEKIIARFPVNERLSTSGEDVVITARPYADAGYNDGAHWRVNVHVRWQAVT